MSRDIKRVLVTGASGIVGRVLMEHLASEYELRALTHRAADFPSYIGDIADLASITPAFEDVDAVVHLAAAADLDSPWVDILNSNLVGTYNVLEAARSTGVDLVVFASTNHVIGMYELEAGSSLYDLDDGRIYDEHTDVRPDSLYGVSKVYGEALGRYYVDRYGLRVMCLRIGSCPPGNDPRLASTAGLELSPAERYARQRAAWLSHRDCAQLVSRCLQAKHVRWAVAYGISDNPRQFWDLRVARDVLGYAPQDHAPLAPVEG